MILGSGCDDAPARPDGHGSIADGITGRLGDPLPNATPGLLDSVPEDAILAPADPADLETPDGITGRVSWTDDGRQDAVPDPEIPAAQAERLATYMRLLGRPPRGAEAGDADRVKLGSTLLDARGEPTVFTWRAPEHLTTTSPPGHAARSRSSCPRPPRRQARSRCARGCAFAATRRFS